jgi:hypothetical protein
MIRRKKRKNATSRRVHEVASSFCSNSKFARTSHRQLDAGGLDAIGKFRPNAGGMKNADHLTVLTMPSFSKIKISCRETVIPLHADDLGDFLHLAAAVLTGI